MMRHVIWSRLTRYISVNQFAMTYSNRYCSYNHEETKWK